MKRAINYIKNPIKTELYLVGGKDCSPDTAYNEFVTTKQNFKKEMGGDWIGKMEKICRKIMELDTLL